MTNTLKKNAIGCLFAITLFLLTSSFAQPDNKLADQKLIKAYYTAYEKKDWSALSSILAADFTFSSPNDDHIDVKTYKQKCWPNAYNIKRFDLEKVMVDGDDGFVTYNGWTLSGKLFRNTEYFKFKNGKIAENVCYFGPGISYPNNKPK